MALLVENSFVRGRKDAGFLPMRAALGGTMIYHGLSKLKEEENRQEAGQMFEQIGIRPGRPLAVATGIAEVFAGVSAVLGFLTNTVHDGQGSAGAGPDHEPLAVPREGLGGR